MTQTILVIDDEPELVRLLDHNLTRAGLLVISSRDGEHFLVLARRHAPDLILLDVMLPGMDGWEVCRGLKRDPATAAIPVIMLTARSEEQDRILGLELGADDYVTKPFGVRELVARAHRLLRLSGRSPESPEVVKVGRLLIDAGRRTVTLAGKAVDVTTTEFDLLRALAVAKGKVISREALIEAARGSEATVMDRTIDTHVASIRRKLGKQSELLETVRGFGYRLQEGA